MLHDNPRDSELCDTVSNIIWFSAHLFSLSFGMLCDIESRAYDCKVQFTIPQLAVALLTINIVDWTLKSWYLAILSQ